MEQAIFSKELFTSENFSVDSFISDYRRRNKPLENLLNEVRKYSISLESELLELINKDYADFVNLSANLSGIDKVIDNLRTPMTQMRKEIQSVKDIVELVRKDFEAKLEQKKELKEKKKLLQLFAAIHQIICKIESLLFVSGEEHAQTVQINSEESSNLIQRVANDFNQLKYYVSCCAQQPFTVSMQFRIARIEGLKMEVGRSGMSTTNRICEDFWGCWWCQCRERRIETVTF